MNRAQQNILKYISDATTSTGITRNCNYFLKKRHDRIDSIMEKGEKRKRSSNFHDHEVQKLLKLINVEKNTTECKRTDQATNNYKDKIWKKIAYTFNQKNSIFRSDKQLRSKWETLKKNARKEVAAGKISEISELVLKITESVNEALELKSAPPLQLKEEPLFDETTLDQSHAVKEVDTTTIEQNNNSFSADGFGPLPKTDSSLVSKKAFVVMQNQITQSKMFEQHALNSEAVENKKVLKLKPIIIPPAFLIQSEEYLLLGGIVNTPSEIQNLLPTSMYNSSSHVEDPRMSLRSKGISRGTQCGRGSAEGRKYKKIPCCHLSLKKELVYLKRKLLLEEYKRKIKKHQATMEILKLELSIKKKQWENMQ